MMLLPPVHYSTLRFHSKFELDRKYERHLWYDAGIPICNQTDILHDLFATCSLVYANISHEIFIEH